MQGGFVENKDIINKKHDFIGFYPIILGY